MLANRILFSSPAAVAFAALTFLLVGAAGAAAQVPITAPPLPRPTPTVTDMADSLSGLGRHEEALEYLEDYLKTRPTDYVAERLAAREALVLAIAQSESDPDGAKETFRRAIDHGNRATALDSLDKESRYFTIAAEGRLAYLGGPRDRTRAAVAVDQSARALLALDSLHAGAHNAMGRLYFELARLPWFERLFARPLVGGDLMSRATWEAAEAHLRRAVELDPRRNLYLLDLGEMLVARKRYDEARPVLDSAVRLPLEFPGEKIFRKQAQDLLDEIDGKTGSSDPRPDST